MDQLIKLNCCH